MYYLNSNIVKKFIKLGIINKPEKYNFSVEKIKE